MSYPAQLIDMAVKPLKLRKKIGIWKVAVNNSYGIIWVHCSNKLIASIQNGLHVTGSDVAGGADECEIFHLSFLFKPS